ncbi:MAG: single-stranded DNA-binding protein [Planctomycetota bacterium]|nr:single-stranded DNA-binding protein [Planctomycetota bacterium]
MADLNRVFLLGRLTRDPTLRHTPGGTPVAEFGIAVNRSWSGPDGERKEETCFVDIVVWSRRAEVCHANLKKASPVFIEGRLHLDTWSSASGERRSRLKVVANNVVFLAPLPGGVRAPRPTESRSPREERQGGGTGAPVAESAAPQSKEQHPETEARGVETQPMPEPDSGSDFPF